MRAGNDAEWYRYQYRDRHRDNGELDCSWIAFENEILDWPIVTKRQSHVAGQQRPPVINISIINTMPDKVSLIVVVAWKREEEGRTIETVLLAKLCKLFRRCLFAEHSDSRITGNELD